MSSNAYPHRPLHSRIERRVEVRLMDVDTNHQFIGGTADTINVSEHGLMMEVPAVLDACEGQEVIASLHWEGGEFESPATIVHFTSPYWRNPRKSVMGLRLTEPLPPDLLVPSEPHY
jgi:hypothetical protein